jgi:tripartite-type tricarboxylate transporter receptor subunit TctC
MLRSLTVIGATAGFALAAQPAAADYPEQPITYIIPYGPGGTSDIGARTWQPFLEECLGTTLVMVNRPGAGGEVGFAELAQAEPDGYTLGALNVPNMPLGAITKEDAGYEIDSFTPLSVMYGSIVTLNAAADSPYKDLDALVEASKSGQVNMGITNVGSDDHIMMLRFMRDAGANFTFIPFTDAASVRNALMGGHIGVGGLSMTEVTEFQDEPSTLAIASEERVPSLPDVPTFKEQGIDLVGGSTHLIGGPAGMPAEVVEKLDTCFTQVAADPEFQQAAQERALLLAPMNQQKTREWLTQEVRALTEIWESDPWGQ